SRILASPPRRLPARWRRARHGVTPAQVLKRAGPQFRLTGGHALRGGPGSLAIAFGEEEARMPKLFVAIDLPAAATQALAAIQPTPTAGVRLVARDQMHLTLHYLGEADRDRTANALQQVAVPPFALSLEGIGQFASTGGAVTLWAGVREGPEL